MGRSYVLVSDRFSFHISSPSFLMVLSLTFTPFQVIRRGAGKSLVFPISYFPNCSTTKGTFLGWIKEVKTTKS
jgi:hypothetical protein